MRQILISGALVLVCGLALAKLPPPTDAAKAKAAEAAAKAAWQAKVEAYQLCNAQDKVAAQYRKAAPQAATGAPAAFAPPPPCTDPGPFAYTPPEQKPPETAGPHSPTGTIASPPGVKPNSAEMAPAKK